MRITKLAAIFALTASTAACATTQKVGKGVAAVVKAPIDVADATLSGTERVLSVADKAVNIVYKTRNLAGGLPGTGIPVSVESVRTQASAVRWALNGFKDTPRTVTYVTQQPNAATYVSAPSYASAAHSAYPSRTTTYVSTARAYTSQASNYVSSSRPQSTTTHTVSHATRTYTARPTNQTYVSTANTVSSYTQPSTSQRTAQPVGATPNTAQTYATHASTPVTYTTQPTVTYSSGNQHVSATTSRPSRTYSARQR